MSNFENDRRLRVQYPNALYHVTSRGVCRNDIFKDDEDRHAFFDRMSETVSRFSWRVYAITLMSNHFHIYFRTPQPNLSRGAQFLLAHYAQTFNRRWRRSGHLFEGRFRCKVIETMSYAWTVSRYVHLKPVAVLVDHPRKWCWSSFPGYCNEELRIPWVCYDDLLTAWRGEFGQSADYVYREAVEQQSPGSRSAPWVADRPPPQSRTPQQQTPQGFYKTHL